MTPTCDYDATIGVELITPDVERWWGSHYERDRAGRHAIVKRRDGRVVTVWWAEGTPADLDLLARMYAETWCATYQPPSDAVPEGVEVVHVGIRGA